MGPSFASFCVSALAPKGFDVLVVDLTTREVAEVGFRVARVLIPGLQPLHEGHRFRFLGGKRLYQVPRSKKLEEVGFNPREILNMNAINSSSSHVVLRGSKRFHRAGAKCESFARARWLQDRQSELLDIQYFHVVFTVPERIATIAYQNKRVLYGILFRAAAETLRTIAADPKHLGAEIGFFAVLHTWG
jgi:hypothetical protein